MLLLAVISYKNIVAAVLAFVALIGFFISEGRRADKEFEKEKKKKELLQSKYKPMQVVKDEKDN